MNEAPMWVSARGAVKSQVRYRNDADSQEPACCKGRPMASQAAAMRVFAGRAAEITASNGGAPTSARRRGRRRMSALHIGGFNLGLLMRTLIGVGTPRGLQGRLAVLMALVIAQWTHVADLWRARRTPFADHSPGFTPHHRFERFPVSLSEGVL